jgi:hypothetical protein
VFGTQRATPPHQAQLVHTHFQEILMNDSQILTDPTIILPKVERGSYDTNTLC